jgi:hypothetical protein
MIIYVISDDKILKYLLNLDHPQGRSKARFLINRGFAFHNPQQLREALQRHPVTATLVQQIPHPDGEKLIYKRMVAAPDGTQPCLTTVWIRSVIRSAEGHFTNQRLVTAYPDSL